MSVTVASSRRPAALHGGASSNATGANPKPRNKSSSRSARLEARLNDLVDLLRSSRAISGEDAAAAPAGQPSSQIPGQPTGPETGHTDGSSSGGGTGPADSDLNSETDTLGPPTGATTAAGSSSSAPSAVDAGDESGDEDLLPHEAEACLQRFCRDQLPLAPFIHIPAGTTPPQMRQQYPILWRCIKSVACEDLGQRVRAAAAARRAIFDEVIERGGRTLDLLLGMLTFVTWVHMSSNHKYHHRFMTMVTQMAVAVAWDLGLTMPPLLSAAVAAERVVPVMQMPNVSPLVLKAHRTLEERRTVLGVYLVSVVMSQMIRSPDGLRWSPYLESCLNHVAQHSDVPQDAILVRQVRMLVLIGQVRYPTAASQAGGCGINAMFRSFGSGSANIPLTYTDALLAQLDEVAGVVNGHSPAFDNCRSCPVRDYL